MNRVFRFRLYPTSRQQAALGAMLADHCCLYNAALQERRDAWATTDYSHIRKTNRVGEQYSTYRHVGKGVRRSYGVQSAQPKAIRTLDSEGVGRWSFSSQQQTLKRLDKAFAAFFRRAKAGQAPGYPRFKAVRRFDTVTFINGDGSKWLPEVDKVRLQGIGHVKVKVHRQVRGTVKQVSVTREGRHWYVNLICVDVSAQVRPLTGAVIGIDKGINHLLADSDGGFVANPRHTRTAAERLGAAQQDLAGCKRGSSRRKKAVTRVARQHQKVKNIRADYLHKTSRQLIDTYDVIVAEKLLVANMVKRPKPKPDAAPDGAAAKGGLNKSILDASWGVLQEMLQYKAEDAGVEVILVNPRNTSRTCHECGHCAGETATRKHSAVSNALTKRTLIRTPPGTYSGSDWAFAKPRKRPNEKPLLQEGEKITEIHLNGSGGRLSRYES